MEKTDHQQQVSPDFSSTHSYQNKRGSSCPLLSPQVSQHVASNFPKKDPGKVISTPIVLNNNEMREIVVFTSPAGI